ncbi:MAG: phosphatase PAP2 family protein, partial [Planctomycetales bacterium]
MPALSGRIPDTSLSLNPDIAAQDEQQPMTDFTACPPGRPPIRSLILAGLTLMAIGCQGVTWPRARVSTTVSAPLANNVSPPPATIRANGTNAPVRESPSRHPVRLVSLSLLDEPESSATVRPLGLCAPPIASWEDGLGPEVETEDSLLPKPQPDGTWFGEPLEDDTAASDPVECCFTWRDDWDQLGPMFWNDTLSLFTCRNALILGAGAGLAIALRENADGEVRSYTAEYPLRWGTGSQVLRQFGEFGYQVPVLLGVYGVSLWTQDDQLHEFSKAVISAYTLTSITTVLIKVAADTQRPTDQFQNGEYGFPSFHAASSFSIAAVLDDYYGWPIGVPAYVLAGLVGWSRIDQREHDLSDVVFGSLL